MKTNKNAIQIAFALAFGSAAVNAHAVVLNLGDRLTINPGQASYDSYGNYTSVTVSWFGVDLNGDGAISANVGEIEPLSQGTQGIVIGTTTTPGASHLGSPVPGDTNAIDAPWDFFGNTGSSFNTVGITGGTSGLDMSGWRVTWNGIPETIGGIPTFDLSGGAWNPANCAALGIANCSFTNGVGNFSWDGIYGHGYTLDYAATVPINDPAGFGGVKYVLHLEGTVQAVPIPAAAWLFGSGLVGLIGFARRRRSTT